MNRDPDAGSVFLGLVFDLDDTLADERDYVRSGFRHVAHQFGRSAVEADELFDWLWRAFEAGVRGDTFDRLRSASPDLAARATTDELVAAYRAHEPAIQLTPGWASVFDELRRRGFRLGVLSDGPEQSQAAKARALGLDRWFDPILLTGALGPAWAKPAPAGFEQIARGWDLAGPALIYVADNPAKDFIGPRRLGWTTIRVRRPSQLRAGLEPDDPASRPDVEIREPADLLAWLDQGT